MEPLISIITPVYNTENYLHQCVDSLLKQTYTNLEIILVDDGSPDNSGKICDQLAEKDSRIKVIHKVNGGLSDARNVGIEASTGDYIAFVDSDDFIAENLFEKVVEAIRKQPADIVSFGIVLTNEYGKPIGSIESIHGLFTERKENVKLLLQHKLNNYVCCKVYDRKVFEGVSFPVGYSWEDVGITYKLFLNAQSIYSIPDKLYFYRQRSTSIVHNITEKALRDIFTMQKRRYDDLLKIYPDVAELAIELVASSALNLLDRSLWATVDQKAKEEAQKFLAENKTKLSNMPGNHALKCYYQNPACYNFGRILKHKIGNVVKTLLRK